MYRPDAYPTNDKDPRLENVRDKLANLRTLIDDAEWNGKPVDTALQDKAKRLTQMASEGTLWTPRF